VTQLVKKYPAFYGTRRSIFVFKRARHWIIPRVHILILCFLNIRFNEYYPPAYVGIVTRLQAGWLRNLGSIPCKRYYLLHGVLICFRVHSAYAEGTEGFFLLGGGGKCTRACSWPLISAALWGQECVELYILSPHTSSWRGFELHTGITNFQLYLCSSVFIISSLQTSRLKFVMILFYYLLCACYIWCPFQPPRFEHRNSILWRVNII
jgi:hypothetical protein